MMTNEAKRRRRVGWTLGLTIAIGAAAVAATSGSDTVLAACEPHKIDLGEGKSVTGGCEPLKIAYLQAATNNVYLQANIQGAKDAAEEVGAEIEVFDANWSPSTQFNQAQNVIASGRFNAILAEYRDAPAVTRSRMYLEALNQVLPSIGSVIVVQEGQVPPVPLLNLRDARPLPQNPPATQ